MFPMERRPARRVRGSRLPSTARSRSPPVPARVAPTAIHNLPVRNCEAVRSESAPTSSAASSKNRRGGRMWLLSRGGGDLRRGHDFSITTRRQAAGSSSRVHERGTQITRRSRLTTRRVAYVLDSRITLYGRTRETTSGPGCRSFDRCMRAIKLLPRAGPGPFKLKSVAVTIQPARDGRHAGVAHAEIGSSQSTA